ncbi:MAG: hypothetical protein H6822_11295 [Planctomycetaceae bacterium]|nr:hypothetical protein [Planctomycetales bacterium]MCB9922759.1 hypothetical protein [Planctomycetaceae bacterium]
MGAVVSVRELSAAPPNIFPQVPGERPTQLPRSMSRLPSTKFVVPRESLTTNRNALPIATYESMPRGVEPTSYYTTVSDDLPAPTEAIIPGEHDIRPDVLRPRSLTMPQEELLPSDFEFEPLLDWGSDAPLGFSGPSSVIPSEAQTNSHFVPVEDLWRVGFPEWDRNEEPNDWMDDSPYMFGRMIDPYNQNVLKGDYPIIGQHTFLNVTASTLALQEFRQVPTPTTPFESTQNPFAEEFFGDPDQYFYSENFLISFDLFHGDTAFKPMDWRLKVTPVFNLNYLDVDELAVVNPNVNAGTTRARQDFSLEEWFVEAKLADLSPNYDFVSVRAGSQPFVSDFRGFIFADVNRSVRLFGNRNANRDQFNLIWFDQTEKETNSLLNTFDDRQQNTVIANYYRQDFIWPGYTTQLSFHYNRDQATMQFDKNNFLVRPDPVGVFQPHQVDAFYVGWAGNGHINRFNISHAFYWAFGKDELNPLAGRELNINAQMAAIELSYDRDWVRFRSSLFWSSGDDDINDGEGGGFDAIFDNPNFAGGEFSYWQRQMVRLFGVNLVNRQSLIPNLRSSKFQGQTNFVNPGLYLVNLGMDADITPRLKLIGNANVLWFEQTEVLEQFVFQSDIGHFIGTDLSLGAEYRPYHNNNVILVGGISGLIPGGGFKDLYNPIAGNVDGLFASFLDIILTY